MTRLRIAIALISTTVLLLFFYQSANASTFVGNGGNSGDVEWLVTLKQIDESLKALEANPPADDLVCTCSDTFKNHSNCDALNSLNPTQMKYCGQALKKQAGALRSFLTTSQSVKVQWTRDQIEVRESGHLRAVDAVTDRSRNQITMNPERFRAMQPFERIFLVSHELLHLTDWESKPLVDEGPVGPFTASEGSRAFINSMAAAITVEADEARVVDRYSNVLRRPQGWKENWIDISLGRADQNDSRTFAVENYDAFQARYRRYFGKFGLGVAYRSFKGEKKILTTIGAEEKVETVSLGASYRYFPFENPLSALGQSHLVLGASLDFVRGKYKINDPFNPPEEGSSEKKRTAASADLTYYFPVTSGFWLSLSVAYQALPGTYDLQGTPLENKDSALSTYLGVSYAF